MCFFDFGPAFTGFIHQAGVKGKGKDNSNLSKTITNDRHRYLKSDANYGDRKEKTALRRLKDWSPKNCFKTP